MKDIRPKAEEKARRKAEGLQQEAPPGDGFMSERTRAKEALREEVNTYTGANVRKIAATTAAAEEERILRVAAYCRVSTDDIDQLISIEMQKNNYRDMIKANPKWKYVGTYVDDGFSGTNTDHQPAFKLMMRDAMAGKIDMIRWCIAKDDKRKSRQITCGLFTAKLYEMMGWEALYRYKLQGTRISYQGEQLYVFDLTSTEIFLPAVKDPDNPNARAKAKPAVYPADWRDSFGIPVMEHMASMQVDLMEGYTFADVSKGTEQMPMEIVDQETGEVIKV